MHLGQNNNIKWKYIPFAIKNKTFSDTKKMLMQSTKLSIVHNFIKQWVSINDWVSDFYLT